VWASVAGEQPGVADGMKLDAGGHLYCCGSGGIHVFDPDGRRLDVIELPEVPANFTWGGRELNQLFATARTSVYRVELAVVGYQPCPPVADLAPPGEEEPRV
jgi:gluconolactonase